ncbi:MAG: hypothetical protein H6849_02585 [Alphaproteobacteria bacterium]|nr:MAG: hypothetical protein H6849_02585 [Alphaproteobacteria bacterium]
MNLGNFAIVLLASVLSSSLYSTNLKNSLGIHVYESDDNDLICHAYVDWFQGKHDLKMKGYCSDNNLECRAKEGGEKVCYNGDFSEALTNFYTDRGKVATTISKDHLLKNRPTRSPTKVDLSVQREIQQDGFQYEITYIYEKVDNSKKIKELSKDLERLKRGKNSMNRNDYNKRSYALDQQLEEAKSVPQKPTLDVSFHCYPPRN